MASRLAPLLVAAFTSSTLRQLRRSAAELRRRVTRAPRRVDYFHQVDDPYSQLAAQTLARLVERYDIVLTPHLVAPPDDDAAPERARLEAYSRKDAADVAPAYGLEFARPAGAPAADLIDLATRLLAACDSAAFAARAATIGSAMWSGDRATLERMASESPPADAASTAALVREGSALRRRLRHYLGATFYYAGEWYWGVDRLHYLEEHLRSLGAARAVDPAPLVAPPQPRPPASTTPPARPIVVEFYASLRSPYTAIAMDRVYDLPRRYPIELRLRPVLPMVMRGLPVPLAKRLYIVLDTKREAERAGVAFGRVADPVGEPVERAFALYPWARSKRREGELLRAFTRAAFAEGVDTGSEAGLRHVVEGAGLSWEEAQAHRSDTGWRDELEANREQMFALGLWGVPSFRVCDDGLHPDFCTWGQDRIWLVEQEIARRLE